MDYNINSVDDDFIFDKNGRFTGKIIKRKGPHRLLLKSGDGNDKYYEFADQKEDPKNILDNYRTNNNGQTLAVPLSKNKVFTTMASREAFNQDQVSPLNFYKNSKGGGRFDYTLSKHTPEHLDRKNTYADATFFLPEGDGYAHNTFNFGNFLWGATGRAAGYPTKVLQAGAHINSLINSKENDYESQLDSPDDQLSIKRGANYVDKNKAFLNKHYLIRDTFGKYKELAKPYSKTDYIIN